MTATVLGFRDEGLNLRYTIKQDDLEPVSMVIPRDNLGAATLFNCYRYNTAIPEDCMAYIQPYLDTAGPLPEPRAPLNSPLGSQVENSMGTPQAPSEPEPE
jgi:hypothetical protein